MRKEEGHDTYVSRVNTSVDVDARTMHKYPRVCIEMPCDNNAEYLQLCIVTGDGSGAEIFASLHSQRRRRSGAPRARCSARRCRRLYKCSFRWRNEQRMRLRCIKHRKGACVRTEFLFNSRGSRRERASEPLHRHCGNALAFLMDRHSTRHFDISSESPNERESLASLTYGGRGQLNNRRTTAGQTFAIIGNFHFSHEQK